MNRTVAGWLLVAANLVCLSVVALVPAALLLGLTGVEVPRSAIVGFALVGVPASGGLPASGAPASGTPASGVVVTGVHTGLVFSSTIESRSPWGFGPLNPWLPRSRAVTRRVPASASSTR